MTLPKSFIKTRMFEVGRTIIHRPDNKDVKFEFYHKKLNWWLDIYGIRLKHHGYYIMVKKVCF